jgi:formate/nitrite transporter FocA (FNT family)
MKNSHAVLREVSSFLAGLLIGLSIVVLVFAMTVTNPGNWQALWVFGAPVLLALGLTLQVVANSKAKPRHPRTTQREFVSLPLKFMDLSRER